MIMIVSLVLILLVVVFFLLVESCNQWCHLLCTAGKQALVSLRGRCLLLLFRVLVWRVEVLSGTDSSSLHFTLVLVKLVKSRIIGIVLVVRVVLGCLVEIHHAHVNLAICSCSCLHFCFLFLAFELNLHFKGQ